MKDVRKREFDKHVNKKDDRVEHLGGEEKKKRGIKGTFSAGQLLAVHGGPFKTPLFFH